MAGWDLKLGNSDNTPLTEMQIWELIEQFLSKKTTMRNLYKINLMKALIKISDKKFENCNIFCLLVEEFGKIFWNLKRDSNINMTIFNGVSKKSQQESLIDDILLKDFGAKYSTFDMLNEKIKTEYINGTEATLKTNVIGAIYNNFNGFIYSFDLKKSELQLSNQFINFFIKYSICADF